jgi:cell wall assembly regulator SMI1
MDPLEAIGRAQATRLVGEDGKEVEFELAPALPRADIERLAAELGVPLSRELRALLERTAGIDGGPLETIDFTGQSLSFGDPDTFPTGLPIAGDGFGNFWVLDLTPDDADTAPVSHEACVVGRYRRVTNVVSSEWLCVTAAANAG